MIKIVYQNDRHYGHHKHSVQLRWSWIINVPGGYFEVPWGYGDALGGYTESSVLELLRQRKAKQRQKDNFVIRIPIWPTWGTFINCVQYFHQHCGAPSFYPPRWSLCWPSAICDDHLCTRGILPIQSFSSIQAVCYKQKASITFKIASLAKITMLWILNLWVRPWIWILVKILKLKFRQNFEYQDFYIDSKETGPSIYCAWLIKWVVKRKKIQSARLCVTRLWIIKWCQLVVGDFEIWDFFLFPLTLIKDLLGGCIWSITALETGFSCSGRPGWAITQLLIKLLRILAFTGKNQKW